MFGTTVLCARGKVFLFPWRDTVVVKVPAGQAGELVASGAAMLFDPGHGCTRKTRVAVLASGRQQAASWVQTPISGVSDSATACVLDRRERHYYYDCTLSL